MGINTNCRRYDDYDYSSDNYPRKMTNKFKRLHSSLEPQFDEDGSQVHNYQAIKSRAKPVPPPKGKDPKSLIENLLNGNLSTKDADSRVPVIKESAIRGRSNEGCADTKCFNCLDSCRFLKTSNAVSNPLSQYTFLRLCSMGCKEEL